MSSARSQNGIALLLMLFLMMVVGTTFFLAAWNKSRLNVEREHITQLALQQAREVVIGEAITQLTITSAGYLPLPDLGVLIGDPKEGYEAGSFSGNNKDYTVIGKLPWKSLGIAPLRDQQGECLWYIVSGRYKSTPSTDALNWDTQGQIDVIDGNGTLVARNMVAALVAPGAALDGQNRLLADTEYAQCGGNYSASNYFDTNDISNAVSGQVNYFVGSTNNRVALDSNNKQFVITNNAHYNDRFLFISADDIFRLIIRRSDFAGAISSLLDDPDFQLQVKSIAVSGAKGTDNLNCEVITDLNHRLFCRNWKEMLFLTQLSAPLPITIDGATISACKRVIIFAGQKTSGQSRTTSAEKTSKNNYLEEPNLSAFAIPIASSNSFSGQSTFVPNQPAIDLLRCMP